MHSDPTLHNGQASTHGLRVARILRMISLALVAIGLAWGAYFATQHNTTVLLLDAFMVGLGLLLAWLVRSGRARIASLLVVPGITLIVVFLALLQDIPTPAAPRSIHHFLLPLGLGAYLLLRDERPWLRHGWVGLCFALFAALASTQWGFDTPLALPDAIRIPGTWFNNATALVLLYACLHAMQADLREQGAMTMALRRALREREFVLYYQPQMGADGKISGAEALVRWNDPVQGLIPPALFIPSAEENGLIVPLGAWVLTQACDQLARWAQDPATRDLSLSVNVSAQQFRQADFVALVLAALEKSGASARRLKLELTETMLASDMDDIVRKMGDLRTCAVRLSLDDFGTGFSSLNYLKMLPLDQLKIDQSFVRDLLHDPHDAAIARTVITLGQSLGLEVIAEGVETPAQRDCLRAMGCAAYQGYLLSPPLPLAEFESFVRSYAATARARPLGQPSV